MKKKKWLIAVLILLIIFVYEIAGAVVPFIHAKKVQTSLMKTESFYDHGQSSDRAAIIESNEEALELRLSMFEDAKESIVFSTFDIRNGESTKEVFSSLLAAANRGVDVKIIVDGLYGMIHMNKEPLFYAAGNHKNIEIKYYNTPDVIRPWTFNGRMHDKYIMIDDKLLLMGGRNTFDYFLGKHAGKSTGYDREVLIYNTDFENGNKNSVIKDVKKYFQGMWGSKDCKNKFENVPLGKKDEIEDVKNEMASRYIENDIRTTDYIQRTVPVNKAVFIHNPTHILAKEPYVWEQLQSLMSDAKEKVVIQTPYAVFSDDMYKGLSEITEKIPDTQMLINSIASGDNICASSDYIKNKSKILDTGVNLYEYMGKYSFHGKSLTIDQDLSVIGSYNFDNRSTYVDTETMLVIQSEEINKELNSYFDSFREGSLKVKTEKEYEENEEVKEKKINEKKEKKIQLLSFVIGGFRYLI